MKTHHCNIPWFSGRGGRGVGPEVMVQTKSEKHFYFNIPYMLRNLLGHRNSDEKQKSHHQWLSSFIHSQRMLAADLSGLWAREWCPKPCPGNIKLKWWDVSVGWGIIRTEQEQELTIAPICVKDMADRRAARVVRLLIRCPRGGR